MSSQLFHFECRVCCIFLTTSYLSCRCQIRAITDECVRATGRQQNDIHRIEGSLSTFSAALSEADLRRNRDSPGASIGDVERVLCLLIHICSIGDIDVQVSRAVESMRLRLDSDARAIAALEQATAFTSDGIKDMKSQVLQLVRKVEANDKKMSGFEGKVRLVEECSSNSYSSPLSSGTSSPAMLRTLERQRALNSTEIMKDSEQVRAQVIVCLLFFL
jgi:hypothetical protein